MKIKLSFGLLCFIFFFSACGGSSLEEAVSSGGGTSASNLSKLDAEKKKFFSVFENLDPAKDISFKVDIFTFLSTDSITATNLTTKEFNPSLDGAAIVSDKVIRFTKGFSAVVKLVLTLSCGKFVLGELKILFCPQSISEVKSAMLWDESITYAAQTQKLLVAANRAVVINGVTVGAIDNIDELIAAVEKSEALPTPTPTPSTGAGGGSPSGTGGGTVGDAVGQAKLEDAKTQASASPTPVPALKEIASLSEVADLTLVSSNTNEYSFGGVTPIGDASAITNNATVAVVLASGLQGSKLYLIDLGEVVPQGGSVPTSYSPTLISTTNLSNLSGINSLTQFRKVGSNASGSKLYVSGKYMEGVSTWRFQIASLAVLLNGNSLAYSSDFSGTRVNFTLDSTVEGPASTVSDSAVVGTTPETMYVFGYTLLSDNKVWYQSILSSGAPGTSIFTTLSGDNNKGIMGNVIPTFNGNTRVEIDGDKNYKISMSSLGTGPPRNKFSITNCQTSFISCGETLYSRSDISSVADNTIAIVATDVTGVYGYTDKYLGAALFDTGPAGLKGKMAIFQTTRSDVTLGSSTPGTISSQAAISVPQDDDIWGTYISPTGNYAVMIVKVKSPARIAFKVVEIKR